MKRACCLTMAGAAAYPIGTALAFKAAAIVSRQHIDAVGTEIAVCKLLSL